MKVELQPSSPTPTIFFTRDALANIIRELNKALQKGDTNKAASILDSRALDVNAAVDKAGNTFLHYAASNGLTKLAGFLIVERKAEVDKQNNSGNTPAHFSGWHGHKGITQLLEEHGADFTKRNWSPEWPPVIRI